MADPIVLLPPSGEQYETNSVSSQNWNVSPPEMFIFWLMTQISPPYVSVKFQFPDYQVIPDYENYTDWLLEASTVHTYFYISPNNSMPFIKVGAAPGVYDDTYSGDLGVLVDGIFTKELFFVFFNIYLLSEGQYYSDTTVKITALNPATGLREVISEKDYRIWFYVNAFTFVLAPPFEVSYKGKVVTFDYLTSQFVYSPITFNYYIGGALPAAEDLFYYGLQPQNAGPPSAIVKSDPSIEAVYIALHPYYSQLAVNFSSAISSLAAGTYEYTLGVGYYGITYPDKIITIPLILNVLDEPAATFSVTPNNLNFYVTVGANLPASQTVSVLSADPWEVISNLPEWLSVSQLSGSGNATLIFTPSNFQNLPEGQYIHEMSISDGTNVIVITITMNLKVFLASPFVTGKLHFTKDLNYLNFISQNNGIYVQLTVNLKVFKNKTYEEVDYERVYSIPLSDKKGHFHLGTIVHDLFDEIEKFTDFVTELSGNYFSTGYKPAVVSIAYEEKQYVTTFIVPELISGSITGILFVKGVSPFITQNQLSLLTAQQQFLSRISKNSVIGINFTHSGTPTVLVKRNNTVIDTQTLTAFGSGRFIYNYYRFENDFKVGDLIEVFVADGENSRSHRYLVHYDGVESTFFFFENQHGVFEPFELIGRRRISSNYKHTLNSRYKNLFAFDEKLKTVNLQSFVINSGTIHPEDHRILDYMIKSEKVWCSFTGPNGNYVRVNCTSTKNLVSDTASNNYDSDVEFQILENTDAIFCL